MSDRRQASTLTASVGKDSEEFQIPKKKVLEDLGLYFVQLEEKILKATWKRLRELCDSRTRYT